MALQNENRHATVGGYKCNINNSNKRVQLNDRDEDEDITDDDEEVAEEFKSDEDEDCWDGEDDDISESSYYRKKSNRRGFMGEDSDDEDIYEDEGQQQRSTAHNDGGNKKFKPNNVNQTMTPKNPGNLLNTTMNPPQQRPSGPYAKTTIAQPQVYPSMAQSQRQTVQHLPQNPTPPMRDLKNVYITQPSNIYAPQSTTSPNAHQKQQQQQQTPSQPQQANPPSSPNNNSREVRSRENMAALFDPHNENLRGRLVVLVFFSRKCSTCNTYLSQYAHQFHVKYPNVFFAYADANDQTFSQFVSKFKVSAVPTFMLIKNFAFVQVLNGFDPLSLSSAIANHNKNDK